jgi:hypothetical protein
MQGNSTKASAGKKKTYKPKEERQGEAREG